MSDTHDRPQCRNKPSHWKIFNLVLDLNYFSLSNSSPNPNPTDLPKHQTLSPNHQFSQRIWSVEYCSVHAHVAWSQKFLLLIDKNCFPEIRSGNTVRVNFANFLMWPWKVALWKSVTVVSHSHVGVFGNFCYVRIFAYFVNILQPHCIDNLQAVIFGFLLKPADFVENSA